MNNKKEILQNLIIISLISTGKVEYGSDTHFNIINYIEEHSFNEIIKSNNKYIIIALQVIKDTKQLNQVMINELEITL